MGSFELSLRQCEQLEVGSTSRIVIRYEQGSPHRFWMVG